ncbi:hypothetical protein DM860_018292 [Cuscuta australis]|uniref:Uncharacterized protein n=1 Tax=Cuscuta australis TaxID=267555 RepID=A0A328CZV6_9ASTE|nr:hypothetical protein DM860_018292 [Cuscuta australis]
MVFNLSVSFQAENGSASVNQNCSFNTYSLLSSQSNNSTLNIGQLRVIDLKSTVIVSVYPGPTSISTFASSCSVNADNGITRQVQNSTTSFSASKYIPGLVPNIYDVQGSYVDEFEAPMSNNLSHGKVFLENNGTNVKQGPYMDFSDKARVGIPLLQQHPSHDLMSVFTE